MRTSPGARTGGTGDAWTSACLVALDLEGSGAQDHEDEAILEIAVVPLAAGEPDVAAAYTTLINPGRRIPRRPWISPGLTSTTLAAAPTPAEAEPELARRINGSILVGHNIGVDWRLLHRRHPAIAPAALIDTLRLARHLKLGTKNSLSALTAYFGLTAEVERLAAGSQPHRALWDTIAAALLLPALIAVAWPDGVTLTDLLGIAAIDLETPPAARTSEAVTQDALFG
jgi:DNA polymerase-3 subunit epsilon